MVLNWPVLAWETGAREINELAVELARKAAGEKAYIAGSLGPTGKLMKPYGELSMEKARENYYRQLSYLVNAGIDGSSLRP